MSRPWRVCHAGTWERGYPRNELVIRALRDAGARVELAHVPVFERLPDKSGLDPGRFVSLAARLSLAWLRLVPEVALRLLRCDALAIGYIGQADMLVFGGLARLMGRPVLFNPLVTLTDTLVEDRRLFQPDATAGRLVRLLDSLALRLATIVLADTDQNAAYLTATFGIERERIVVVPVGADEEVFFTGDDPGREPGSPYDVLFYGKFIPLHGVATIIEAAAELGERGVPVRIEMVGRGQEYRRARTLACRLGVTNVRWVDWVPPSALGDRLREADVVLGIFGDTAKAGRVVPNKVYQALACGKPVVTRNGPTAEALLRDGENALLVPPADPTALADAVERLIDPAARRRLGEAAAAAFQREAGREALAAQIQPALSRLGFRR
jgi:glycosyltransferase involved in cell wall biosynthesis